MKDTNINNGEVNDAADLTACQEVCISLPNCTGVDWNPSSSVGSRCWLSGPWSGTRNAGVAVGITHYDLTRACRGTGDYPVVSAMKVKFITRYCCIVVAHICSED